MKIKCEIFPAATDSRFLREVKFFKNIIFLSNEKHTIRFLLPLTDWNASVRIFTNKSHPDFAA